MFDTQTPLGRMLQAALALAAEKPWADVTLAEIADRAGLPLNAVRGAAAGKSELLAQLLRAIDDEVLKTAPRPAPETSRRDALFEVIMSRLDLLAPHKAALASIHASGSADFALAAPYLASQHWMLQAAGISTDGLAGRARVAGLALAYARVFRVWLSDDDAGLGKTMAVLDRALRRGETALNSLQNAGSTAMRFARAAGEAAQAAARTARESGARAAAPGSSSAATEPTGGGAPPEPGKI